MKTKKTVYVSLFSLLLFLFCAPCYCSEGSKIVLLKNNPAVTNLADRIQQNKVQQSLPKNQEVKPDEKKDVDKEADILQRFKKQWSSHL